MSFAKNLSYNYLGTITVSVVGFLSTPILIKLLGVNNFGAWALLSALIAYSSLFDLGAGLAGMKLIAERDLKTERKHISQLFSNVFILYVFLGVIFLVAGLALLPFLNDIFKVPSHIEGSFTLAYIFVVLAAALGFSGASLTATLQGVHDFKTQNMVVIWQNLANTLMMVLAAYFTRNLVYTVAASGLVTLATCAVKFWLVHRKGIIFSLSLVSKTVLKKIFNFGASAFVINVASRIIFDTDTIVIGAVAGTAAVANYQVALGPSVALRRIGDQLNSVTLTTSSRLFATNLYTEMRTLYLQATKYSLLIMIPFIAAVSLLGKDLLRVWVGPEFVHSSAALTFLIIAVAVVNLQSTSSQVILSVGKHRLLAVVISLEAIANLLLSIFLLKKMGIVGVALGTLIPTACTAFLYTMPVAGRIVHASYWRTLLGFGWPLLAAGLAAPFLIVAQRMIHFTNLLQVVAVGGLYLVLYGIVLFLIDREIRNYVLQLKQRVFKK